ncbi:RNA polymerase sigma factor [Paenibacillus sp. FSL K6-0108]|uniref:RNA polymerase sigma factor n=1 Tax=Paenibacillus sp. FSL K6-0108 TaxID=2921417 RepID=UPI00324E13F9
MNSCSYLFQTSFDKLSPQQQEMAYRSFYNLVYKDILYYLHDHSLTEDVIQEAFLKITRIIHKYKIESYPAWMKQVTRHIAIDYFNKTNKSRQTISLDSVIRGVEDELQSCLEQVSVATTVENNIRNQLLHQSITELRPSQQIIIRMFYIEDLSYKEISSTLDLSEQAVSQKLARARKKLLQNFQRKWDDFYEP